MLNVALTGNIAAGKSTVAELFRSWGAVLIEADRLVRDAQAPGTPVLRLIAARFGADLIGPAGELDRAALRQRVMGDPAARAELERLVHPEVARRRAALLAEARARGARIVVSDIPLLFESLDPAAFDAVVLVDAPEPVRRARLVARRGLSAADADRMLAAQLPSAEKRTRSAYVIDNDADPAALERRAREVWEALVARA
ncbi:MAG TPA: dephospho-CoA kinase [Gemmatimonadales bacterium]|jgi:dephospho-CoA kinase|nr:dephospho-CoA kinase [Gemmatimonadales bacterium]